MQPDTTSSNVAAAGTHPSPPTTVDREQPARAPEHAAHPRVDEALTFARQHPALSILGAAGVSLLGGLELAAGLLLGIGVSSVLRQKNGRTRIESHEIRERARRLLDRTPRELVKRGRAVVQAARGKISPAEEISEPSREPTITHS